MKRVLQKCVSKLTQNVFICSKKSFKRLIPDHIRALTLNISLNRNFAKLIPNRFQTGSKPVPNRCQTGSKPVPNRFQTSSKPVPSRFQTNSKPVTNRFQTDSKPVPNWFQTGSKLVLNRFLSLPDAPFHHCSLCPPLRLRKRHPSPGVHVVNLFSTSK